MAGFHVGQHVIWNGIDAFVVEVDGKTARVAIAIKLRDQDPPQEGWLDEELEEIVRHADAGDWLPLWVDSEAIRPSKARPRKLTLDKPRAA